MSWSVVVVGKGMWPVTEKCLNTLLVTTQEDSDIAEIFYADNGTPPEEMSWDQSGIWSKCCCPSQVAFHRRQYVEAASLPNIWNEAILSSVGEHILLVNNDMVFHQAAWLPAVQDALDEPGVGVSGMIGMSWKGTSFIQGSLFAFKRETYDLVGGFDPQFEFTVEEVDWCRRLAIAGLGIKSFERFREEGVISHAEGATRNYYKDSTKYYQYLAHLSRLRFCYKWTYPDINIHD